MLPPAAAEHYRRQQGISAATVVGVRRAWRRIGTADNWEDVWFDDAGPRIIALVGAAQLAAARTSEPYVAAVSAQTGVAGAAAGTVAAESLAGTASDGRDLAALLYGAIVAAGRAQTASAAPAQALQAGLSWLEMVVQSQVADAERVATKVAMAVRPTIPGYVRMLNPPSCSRCAILAGAWFRWNKGFDRHPRCDCRHIPAAETDRDTYTTNPTAYFESLSRAEQDRIFTNDGAEAIRLGADPIQVVNARSGMSTTVLSGRQLTVTTQGTTRRGTFGLLEAQRGGGTTSQAEELVTRLTRTGPELRRVRRSRTQRARLMPESILEFAQDRDDAIRLLKLYGYIT